MTTSIVQIESPKKTQASSVQKTFNRLKRKIAALQQELATAKKFFEDGLHYFYSATTPYSKTR